MMKSAFFRPKTSVEPDFEVDSFAESAAQAATPAPLTAPAPSAAVHTLPAGLGSLCEDATFDALSITENSPAYIDATMTVRGPLETSKNLVIDGCIHGDVVCGGLCMVRGRVYGSIRAAELRGAGARIRGEVESSGAVSLDKGSAVLGGVHADSAEIYGSVAGDLFLTHACTLGATAYIKGCIHAEFAEIARGAYFEGQMLPVKRRDASPMLAELVAAANAAEAPAASANAAVENAAGANAAGANAAAVENNAPVANADAGKTAPNDDSAAPDKAAEAGEAAPTDSASATVQTAAPRAAQTVTESSAAQTAVPPADPAKTAGYKAALWSSTPVAASEELVPPATPAAPDKTAALSAEITASVAEEIAEEDAARAKKPGKSRRH